MNRIADAVSGAEVPDVNAADGRDIGEHNDVDAEAGAPVDPSRVDGEDHPLMHWARMIEETVVNSEDEQALRLALFSDDDDYGTDSLA